MTAPRPGQSNRVPRRSRKNSFESTSSSAPTSAIVAMGRFMRNTHLHPSTLTSSPPITGPAMPPAPMTLMCVPSPLPRSSSGKMDVTIAMPTPCVIAAPVPWITREATSIRTLVDDAANTDAPINSSRPTIYTCLRPTMSESRPIGSSSALTVRVWAMTTHCTVGRSVWKCPAMVGSATLIMPIDMTPVNDPSPTAPNTHHL